MEIRQKWLYTYIVLTMAALLYSFVGVMVGAHSAMVLFLQNLMFTVVNVAAVMHCSYVSRGTRLLVFMAYLYPFSVIASAGVLVYFYFAGHPILYVHYANIVLSPIMVYFAWTCHLLRARYLKERKEAVMMEEATS